VTPTGTDPGDSYWEALPASFDQAERSQLYGRIYPFFVAPPTMFGALLPMLGSYPVEMLTVEQLAVDRFDVRELDALQGSFDALREDMRSAGGFVRSPIERALDSFETELNFSEVPILLLLVQVVGIVLFYVVIVSIMAVERDEGEIVLLRSRGTSLRQLLGIYAGQGLAIAVVAALIAPFIAAGAIGLLGFTGTFSDVTGGAWIDTELTATTWGLAALGAVVSIGAILIPVVFVARLRAVEYRRRAARPSGPNVLQRYYLDLAFVVVAAGLIAEASRRGSVFERDAVGGLTSDVLLLVTPALFALAFVIVIMRLLPYVLRALNWLVRDFVALPVAAALRQTVRNPGPSTRLAMLLMLGAALGTFAASYGGTVDRSFEERTRYAAGVDLRAELNDVGTQPVSEIEAAVLAVPGVTAASAIHRRDASTARTSVQAEQFELLALDPRATEQMLWFREDLAPVAMADLMRSIGAPDVGRGIALPDDVATVSIWARSDVGRENTNAWVRLRDGSDRYFSLFLGPLDVGGEWQKLQGDLDERVTARALTPPFSLHAVILSEPTGLSTRDATSVEFDDLATTTRTGELMVLEDFEGSRLGWQPVRLSGERIDAIQRIESDSARSGRATLEFEFAVGASVGRRGFFVEDPVLCPGGTECRVPLVASTSFLRTEGLSVGDRTELRVDGMTLPATVVQRTDFFPTLDPAGRGFVVGNIEHLNHLMSVQRFEPGLDVNEIWLDGPSDEGLRAAMITTLGRRPFGFSRFVDQQRLLAEEGADPLTAAGGSGILLVSFVAVGGLIVLAVLVTLAITARRRGVEMAVMRTLGVSRGQMLGQLTAEYALIVVLGLVVGTVLGMLITDLMLSFLEVSESGAAVLPPFVLDTDWTVIAVGYGILVGVFALGVAGSWRFFVRLALNRALRLGE
jgi:ABC-type lipoprotein release transport system permease subunit